jgi:small ligand-binding sensory domain FIST
MAEASGAYLVGGLTASRRAQPQIAGKLTSGGVSGVMFSDRVTVITGLTQGCLPIGPPHRVTAFQGNVVQALDGRPPFEVLREEAGSLPEDLRRLGDDINVALLVGGADRPDYTVRNLMGIDPENGPIAIGALIEEGQSLMFCRRGAGPAEADLDRMLSDLRRRVGDATPRGALYYACVARGPNMFGPGNREARRINEAFGDLPLVGFYGAGEISNARLYGYTGVLSLFM